MYAFAQRADTQVSDEPFYANYLQLSGVEHPGRSDVLAAQSTNRELVLKELLALNSPVLFIKNMAHHYSSEMFAELLTFKNILYIRNPRATIRSYAKVIESPSIDDVGILKIKKICDFLIDNNHRPIIFDSDDLIINPEKSLKKLCYDLELDFDPKMLHWSSGKKDYDGVWAKYWYASIHASTGFVKNPDANSEKITLSPKLEELAQQCIPTYQYLKNIAALK